MDKKFSVERNHDLVDFCRATGLRRRELKVLRVDHVVLKSIDWQIL
jgi:hypothetical protein